MKEMSKRPKKRTELRTQLKIWTNESRFIIKLFNFTKSSLIGLISEVVNTAHCGTLRALLR